MADVYFLLFHFVYMSKPRLYLNVQTFAADLRGNMSGISLYGVVINILRDSSTPETVFTLTIHDTTGEAVVKLHFILSWWSEWTPCFYFCCLTYCTIHVSNKPNFCGLYRSLGRLGLGHTVYISGLKCLLTKHNR